ncbi:abscisic acid receptor PYL9-like isoform X2 [Solanum pennellii]|uniref:Abscisic acid receptor PYL9-like isoform X2 n=1 Tax=Solanum pennellii TaxID=28526 RepID=A0ABM1V181_SOLPN|nr:abscisic acid receptor PYL9-like isoform X2 [Solanum pennellii]
MEQFWTIQPSEVPIGDAFWTLLIHTLPILKTPPLNFFFLSIFWLEMMNNMEDEYIRRHHRHVLNHNQCSSSLVKRIRAPVNLVWSLVRRFDQPQRYKPFVSRCVVQGDLEIGSVREVNVRSGLPATTSKERLELLDDEEHIFGVKIVGGDHRLQIKMELFKLFYFQKKKKCRWSGMNVENS